MNTFMWAIARVPNANYSNAMLSLTNNWSSNVIPGK